MKGVSFFKEKVNFYSKSQLFKVLQQMYVLNDKKTASDHHKIHFKSTSISLVVNNGFLTEHCCDKSPDWPLLFSIHTFILICFLDFGMTNWSGGFVSKGSVCFLQDLIQARIPLRQLL
jgi:hypothetical protein